jgi:hypothetical protein
MNLFQVKVPREQASTSSSSSSEAPAHSALTCTRASAWGGAWSEPNGAGSASRLVEVCTPACQWVGLGRCVAPGGPLSVCRSLSVSRRVVPSSLLRDLHSSVSRSGHGDPHSSAIMGRCMVRSKRIGAAGGSASRLVEVCAPAEVGRCVAPGLSVAVCGSPAASCRFILPGEACSLLFFARVRGGRPPPAASAVQWHPVHRCASCRCHGVSDLPISCLAGC